MEKNKRTCLQNKYSRVGKIICFMISATELNIIRSSIKYDYAMIKFLLKKKLYRSFIRKLKCFLHSRFWLNVCFFIGQTLSVRVKINRKLNLFFKISPDQVFWRILNSHHWINSRSNPRVSIRGVKSLWVDRRFMPADQGSYWVICAICSF